MLFEQTDAYKYICIFYIYHICTYTYNQNARKNCSVFREKLNFVPFSPRMSLRVRQVFWCVWNWLMCGGDGAVESVRYIHIFLFIICF